MYGPLPSSEQYDSVILGLDPSLLRSGKRDVGADEPPMAQLLALAHLSVTQDPATGKAIPLSGIAQLALAHYAGDPIEAYGWEAADGPCIWRAVPSIPLLALTDPFRAEVLGWTETLGVSVSEEGNLQRLCNVLFHPLQNASVWGRIPSRRISNPFCGLLLARRGPGLLGVDSLTAWIAKQAGAEFLEVVVHDHGMGIPAHFGHRFRLDPERIYETEAVGKEWLSLWQAFEKHASSRDQETLDSPGDQPGIGLTCMLASLRGLGGFLEVRTGRLVGYRPLDKTDRLGGRDLLWPRVFPENSLDARNAGLRIQGTLVRAIIPLPL